MNHRRGASPMVEGFRSLAEGRIDERPADLRLYGAASRSAGLDVLMQATGAAVHHRADGGHGAPRCHRRFRRRSSAAARPIAPPVSIERTERLLLAIGTPSETEPRAAAIAEVGGDNVLAPVAGFVFGGAAALARGLAGDAATRAAGARRTRARRCGPMAAVGVGVPVAIEARRGDRVDRAARTRTGRQTSSMVSGAAWRRPSV